MTAVTLRLVVTPEVVDGVPLRVWRRAQQGCWPTCDVCRWPIDAAAVPARQDTPRHPSCVCVTCSAPLGRGDTLWHPQCRPERPTRTLRVIGGRR